MNKTEEAAWRVNGGATATFHRCTFASNRVETPNAGPAIGLRSDGERSGQGAPSSAWIMGCTFEDNRPLEKGDVSVQAGSRLYSNLGPSGYPKVWDVQSGRLTDVWRLTGSAGVAELPGDAQKFNPVPFATERDRFFQDAVQARPSRHAVPQHASRASAGCTVPAVRRATARAVSDVPASSETAAHVTAGPGACHGPPRVRDPGPRDGPHRHAAAGCRR